MKVNMIETLKAADSEKPFGPWVRRVKVIKVTKGVNTISEPLIDQERVIPHEEATKMMAFDGWEKFVYKNPDGSPYYVYYQATTFDTEEDSNGNAEKGHSKNTGE